MEEARAAGKNVIYSPSRGHIVKRQLRAVFRIQNQVKGLQERTNQSHYSNPENPETFGRIFGAQGANLLILVQGLRAPMPPKVLSRVQGWKTKGARTKARVKHTQEIF